MTYCRSEVFSALCLLHFLFSNLLADHVANLLALICHKHGYGNLAEEDQSEHFYADELFLLQVAD